MEILESVLKTISENKDCEVGNILCQEILDNLLAHGLVTEEQYKAKWAQYLPMNEFN